MPNIPDLVEVQAGKETTWGTPVDPTAKLMGIESCVLRPINEAVVHPQKLGSLAPGPDASLTRIAGEGAISGILLYDDFPYWLDNLLGEATPTGADPYTYTYSAPAGSVPTPRILTIVHGDGTDVYGLEGGLVSQLVISGASKEPLKFSANLIGENVVPDALAALSDRSVNVAMAQHLALYIDVWGGTIGTTQITTTFFSFELTINTNRAVYHGFGALTPANYREIKYNGVLKMSLEFDATSKAFLDAIIDGSAVWQKQVRLKASNGASLDAQLDFAGTTLKAPETFTDSDGVITVDVEMEGTYNSALGNWFEAEVVNGVATLP